MQAQSYAADVFNTPVKKHLEQRILHRSRLVNPRVPWPVSIDVRFNLTVHTTVHVIAVKYESHSRGDLFV